MVQSDRCKERLSCSDRQVHDLPQQRFFSVYSNTSRQAVPADRSFTSSPDPAIMVSVKVLLLSVSISGLAAARPEPTPAALLEDRAVDCAKVTGALSVLKKLGPPATTFCSAYLKVPAKSTTTTTLTTTSTPAPVYVMSLLGSCEKNYIANEVSVITIKTTTVDVTSAVCPAARRRNSYAGDDNRRPRVANVPDIELRADAPDFEKRTDVLASLAAFAAAKISEGCSCLGLKPAVVTTTRTTTSTAATPVCIPPCALATRILTLFRSARSLQPPQGVSQPQHTK